MIGKDQQEAPGADAPYQEAGLFAMGRMYATFFRALVANGMSRREALTLTVEWLRTIALTNKQQEDKQP